MTVAQGVVLGGGLGLGQVVFALWVILAGHVIVQVDEPFTVTAKLHVASTVLDWSVALQLTCVVPTGKEEPEFGLHTIVTLGQEPIVVGVEKVTMADPEPGALSLTVLSSGHSIPHVDTLIVTEKLQETVMFAASVPSQVTGVVPRTNEDPDGGLQTTDTQLPVVVGAG
ncbi:MAG: hypothetical protein WAU45_17415 [Blastocatellia bacterium]